MMNMDFKRRWLDIAFYLYWWVVAMVWYRVLLFVPLDGFTAGDSKKILWCSSFLMMLVGSLVTPRRYRNNLSMFVNIMLPLEIYGVVSFWDLFNSWIKIVLSVTALISAVFFLLVVFRRISKEIVNKKDVFRKRLVRAFVGVTTIVTVCLSTVLVPISINSLFGTDLLQAKNGDEIALEHKEKWSVEENMDTLLKIKPEIWETLSANERLEVLSVLKNMELCHLGINHEVYLATDSLEEKVLGKYVQNDRKIVIDLNHLKNSSSEEVFHTLLHECYHAYTFQQIDLYKMIPDEYRDMLMFRNVSKYEKEYENYAGDGNFREYASQRCERDANSYADDALERYCEAIFEYETKGEEK